MAAYAELTVCEASLYKAALDNDVARATALLAIPGVRPDGYRHARVRATLTLPSLSVCRLSPPPPERTAMMRKRVQIARLAGFPTRGQRLSPDASRALALLTGRPVSVPLSFTNFVRRFQEIVFSVLVTLIAPTARFATTLDCVMRAKTWFLGLALPIGAT